MALPPHSFPPFHLRSLQEPARSTTGFHVFLAHTCYTQALQGDKGVKPLSELTARGRASRMPLWSFWNEVS